MALISDSTESRTTTVSNDTAKAAPPDTQWSSATFWFTGWSIRTMSFVRLIQLKFLPRRCESKNTSGECVPPPMPHWGPSFPGPASASTWATTTNATSSTKAFPIFDLAFKIGVQGDLEHHGANSCFLATT